MTKKQVVKLLTTTKDWIDELPLDENDMSNEHGRVFVSTSLEDAIANLKKDVRKRR